MQVKKVRASMAVETSDEPFVSIRCAIVTNGDENMMKIQSGTLGATSGATSKMRSDDHITLCKSEALSMFAQQM